MLSAPPNRRGAVVTGWKDCTPTGLIMWGPPALYRAPAFAHRLSVQCIYVSRLSLFYSEFFTGPAKFSRARSWDAEAGRRRGADPGSRRGDPTPVWSDREQSRGAKDAPEAGAFRSRPEDSYFLAGPAGAGSRVTPSSWSFFRYFSGFLLNSASQPLQQK